MLVLVQCAVCTNKFSISEVIWWYKGEKMYYVHQFEFQRSPFLGWIKFKYCFTEFTF